MIPSQDVDRLFNLLPAIYRQRDADEQGQLKALLRVIAEQVNNVEADIAQLYENWFIETCQQWVIPYIGDLVGYQSVSEIAETGDILLAEELAQNKITISRREVGNTIHNRRRKGTLSLLEQLAWDVANWPAHAVEFFKLLDITQNINARQLVRGRTVDIRDNAALAHIGGPFVREAHNVDVRHIVSPYTPGRYNLPGVGLFILYQSTDEPTPYQRAEFCRPHRASHAAQTPQRLLWRWQKFCYLDRRRAGTTQPGASRGAAGGTAPA